jgi:hypothetical protein
MWVCRDHRAYTRSSTCVYEPGVASYDISCAIPSPPCPNSASPPPPAPSASTVNVRESFSAPHATLIASFRGDFGSPSSSDAERVRCLPLLLAFHCVHLGWLVRCRASSAAARPWPRKDSGFGNSPLMNSEEGGLGGNAGHAFNISRRMQHGVWGLVLLLPRMGGSRQPTPPPMPSPWPPTSSCWWC